jgi:hypothetical protein
MRREEKAHCEARGGRRYHWSGLERSWHTRREGTSCSWQSGWRIVMGRQGPAAEVGPRSASRPFADRRRGLYHPCVLSYQRCEDATLLVRLGGIPSGAEITSCVRTCGSSDVVSCGKRMRCAPRHEGEICWFAGLGLRRGYIAMLMYLSERETYGRGAERGGGTTSSACGIQWGRCRRRKARWGRCGGSKDRVKEGKTLVGGSRRWVYKVGSRGERGRCGGSEMLVLWLETEGRNGRV